MHWSGYFGLGLIALAVPECIAADAGKLPGGTWATIAQLPDMGGVWEMTFGGRRGAGAAPQQPSLTPKYAAMLKEFQAHPPHDSPQANCVPPGMPGIMSQPYPIEILFTPGMDTVIVDTYM